MRSASDSSTPFGRHYLSEGRTRTPSNAQCFPSDKMISKTQWTTPRTPLLTVKVHSLQHSRMTLKEELERPRTFIKPLKIFKDPESESIFCDKENEVGARTPSGEESFAIGKKTSKSPLKTPCTWFETPKSNSQLHGQRTQKGALKRPQKLMKPFKIFEDSEAELIFDHVNDERARTQSNEGCFIMGRKTSKSLSSTPRTPFQRLKFNSQQYDQTTLKELKIPHKVVKPFKIFEDFESETIFLDNVNMVSSSEWETENNCSSLPSNLNEEEKYVNGIRRRKYVPFNKKLEIQKLCPLHHCHKTQKEALKSPYKLTKPLKLFEDPDVKFIFQNNMNDASLSKSEAKSTCVHLPDNSNEEEKYVNGIRRRKYVLLDKKSKHGKRTPKELKRPHKLRTPFNILKDPKLESIFYDNENDLPPTETIGEPFWSEETYSPIWDDMLTREEIIAIHTNPLSCSNSIGISDLPVTPESQCMINDDAGFEVVSVPRYPAVVLVVESPEDIPLPWEA